MGLAVTKQEAFWEACGYGRLYEVKAMLEDKSINVNWKSYTHDCCPIHVASQGKTEIVRLLLDAKCDVNAKDDRDNLAIHHAAMRGHTEIIQMLLDAGSLIDAQDKNGWTPLINAAYWGQLAVVQLLIKNRANIHLKNKDKRTALHEVCRSTCEDEVGLAEIVRLLSECGCDIDSKSSDIGEADFTPLMFCAYHRHPEVAKVLVDAKCKINAQGSNGWSALHWAADRDCTQVVQVLLDANIDCFLTGRRGEMAIHRAKDNQVKQMLLRSMNCSGDKVHLDLNGESTNMHLYIPRPLSGGISPVSPTSYLPPDTTNGTVLQAMKQQMSQLQQDILLRKNKSVRKPIELNRRLFQPPKPPEELKHRTASAPSMTMAAMTFGFMDDESENEAESKKDLLSHATSSDENSLYSESSGRLSKESTPLSNGLPADTSSQSSPVIDTDMPTPCQGENKIEVMSHMPENGQHDDADSVNSSPLKTPSSVSADFMNESEIDGDGFDDNHF